MFTYVGMSMYRMREQGAPRVKKRELLSWELKLQIIVSCQILALGIKLGLQEQYMPLTAEQSL